MKRLLDDHAHDVKRRRGEEVYSLDTLLAEHVGEVVSHSLEAVLPVACLNKRFLSSVQEHAGRHIWAHKDWCAELRLLVEESFKMVTLKDNLLMLPFLDPFIRASMWEPPATNHPPEPTVRVPWTILVEPWIRWNSWADRMPASVVDRRDTSADSDDDDDAAYTFGDFDEDAELGEWADSFQLFPREWVHGRLTERRKMLIQGTCDHANWFLRRLLPADLATRILLLAYFSMLEYAIRVVYRQGTPASADMTAYLTLMYVKWPSLFELATADECTQGIAEMEFTTAQLAPQGSLVFQNLVAALPRFAFANIGRKALFTAVYDSVFSLTRALNLGSPVRYAVDNGVPMTRDGCELLARFARVQMPRAPTPELIAASYTLDELRAFERDYVTDVPHTGSWQGYWEKFDHEAYHSNFVQALRLMTETDEL
jgi:hypothetical protein